MGLEMELDFKKSYSSDLSPNTVLPCRHFPDVEKKSTIIKPTSKDELLTVKEGFTEISFRRYRSASCKTPSRPVDLEGSNELKRGSVYQSSREARKIKKMGSKEGRRKIEFSRDSDTAFSFSIVDSLCCSDEENTYKKSPALSVSSSLNPSSGGKPRLKPHLSDDFIEICPNFVKRENPSFETVRSDSVENPIFRSEQVVGPENDANDLDEKDIVPALYKSLSAKVEMPHPSPSESDCSSKARSKSRFSPIRKMFDPFMKSKSLWSPLGHIAEPGDVNTSGKPNMWKNQNLRKSLLHDFSPTVGKLDSDQKHQYHSAVACSPVHLHGSLKLENKHGVPYFEFSLDCPEEVFVAKTWKANNAFNCVYTFHNICSRKKSNASNWGLTDGNKECSQVGQMQVSCYLCSELKDGVFDNSMVTEFVLYDIAHARKSVSTLESPDMIKPPNCPKPGNVLKTLEQDNSSDVVKQKHQLKCASDSVDFDATNPYPWSSSVLHSDLEIAAIVLQLPLAKRESLKYEKRKTYSDKPYSNILNQMVEQRRKDFSNEESPEKVKVIIPTGNHSLPIDESWGPSSLLDRWRLGGGCDCGGWDMACPLTVFGSPGTGKNCAADELLINDQQPLELFVQGTKQKIPALSMRVVEEGQYAVDFHAQLSTLQAFSICVAVLHGTEASNAAREERNKQLPHCNSLKALIEEEVHFLFESVTEEEKKNKKTSKKMEDIQQPYMLNPPFSPISRV